MGPDPNGRHDESDTDDASLCEVQVSVQIFRSSRDYVRVLMMIEHHVLLYRAGGRDMPPKRQVL